MADDDSMLAKIYALRDMSAAELAKVYVQLLGEKPARLASARQLRPRIAYRMQELAYGGLSPKTEQRMERILCATPGGDGETPLMPGVKIVKEYRGKTYEVAVRDKGYSLGGIDYRSLSAVAKAITGTNWNGRRFFDVK